MAQLICHKTGETYTLTDKRWQSDSGGLLDIDFEAQFPWEQIRKRPTSLWRYREALAISPEVHPVTLGEGFTPLLKESFEGCPVQLKLEYLFPSGSYKDRGASVLMTQVRALGIQEVVQDSSGNAGAAIANYAARAGVSCHILLPETTSPGKVAQAQLYGAKLRRVPGPREESALEALKIAQNLYYASHVWNPFFLQGTKTLAYELWEQGAGNLPDTLVVPAGNGSILLGAYLGFQDLQKAGLLDKIPRMIAVQAAACAPLYHAFVQDKAEGVPVVPKPTLAEGIAIADAKRGHQMLDVVRNTQGRILRVREAEIKHALMDLAQRGYYVEPTSAAVIAGLLKYIREYRQEGETLGSVLTGHGLKSSEKILKLLAKFN